MAAMRTPLTRLGLATATLLLAGGALAACGGGGGSSLPTLDHGFETSPKLTFPGGGPPSGLKAYVLHQGTGAVVQKGQLLVANYLGQIWQGKVFDSSFSRTTPSAFPIGIGDVIKGWDETLVGRRLGSRMLLVIPPADGYPKGNSQAGITKTDTLVFVVDLLGAYGSTTVGPGAATRSIVNKDGVTVDWGQSGAPKVTIDPGFVDPTKPEFAVLNEGTGPPTTDGFAVIQYEVVECKNGKDVESSWQKPYPATETLGGQAPSSTLNLDDLVGLPVGSRVLFMVPKEEGQGPYAVAIEVLGSFPNQHF